MYKPTDRQVPLWSRDKTVPESVARRLRDTWADGFQRKVLPVLLEAEPLFAGLYADGQGRPNWSVARLLGICLLQELRNLDDQSALDSLAFDVRWQHALGLTGDEAYLSRRSLVEFRRRLVGNDGEMGLVREVFDRIAGAALADLGVSTKEQRADSTHIVSNIAIRGRVDLFKKTLRHFLRGVEKRWPSLLARLPAEIREWYEHRPEGWFGRDTATQQRQRLDRLAKWAGQLVDRFADDKEVAADERYGLLMRLVNEHCEPVIDDVLDGAGDGDEGGDDNDNGDGDGDDDGGGSTPRPDSDASASQGAEHGAGAGRTERNRRKRQRQQARKKLTKASTALHSPHDPDAGFGRKGGGYLAHFTETCGNSGTEVITDYEVVGAGVSDKGKSTGILERLAARGWQPERLHTDGGYTTGEAILEAAAMGTDLNSPATRGRLPEGSVGREAFTFDEASGDILACPQGHAPKRHDRALLHGETGRAYYAYFDGETCRTCPLEGRCVARGPNSKKPGAYHVEVSAVLRARDRRLAKQAAPSFWDVYAIRAGAEATMSEMKRAHGQGRLRVRGRARVLLATAMKASACNVKRWLKGRPSSPASPNAEPPMAALAGPERAKRAPQRLSGAATRPKTSYRRLYPLPRPSHVDRERRRAA